METFLEHLKKLKEIYLLILFFVSTIITVYNGYVNIQDSIARNTEAVERTQITMLKGIVRTFERIQNCYSRSEYDEYLLNYSTLFDLKIKYKMLSSKATWIPIKGKICVH